MTPSQLMQEWKQTRDEYFEAVDRRDEEVRTLGVTSSETFKSFEKGMNTRLNRLRVKLAKFFPELFHYGRKTRNKDAHYAKKQKVCGQGDHGFWICSECRQLFEFDDKRDRNRRGIHKFCDCTEHLNMKVVGTMSLKPVLDWCL